MGLRRASAPRTGLSCLTDRQPTDCLCVSMGNGAVSLLRRPWGYPSVSQGLECMVCVTSKTNGQEVQPEKQYLQNIYSEKRFGSVHGSRTISTKPRARTLILIDEPVYLKDARAAVSALTDLIYSLFFQSTDQNRLVYAIIITGVIK